MIEIQEVIRKARVGMCTPYLCRDMNGDYYYVKAASDGILQNRDLIHEWICGHLAKALGLPIPEFTICEITEELFEVLPEALRDIGYGFGFASKAVSEAIWLESHHMTDIPSDLTRLVLLFDYWIQNTDRTDGNPNMILSTKGIRAGTSLRIIDHNLAFDPDFSEEMFFSETGGHIFANEKNRLFADLALRSELSRRMDVALKAYSEAIRQLPASWAWRDIEQSIPIDVDYGAVWAILTRYQYDEFWSMK